MGQVRGATRHAKRCRERGRNGVNIEHSTFNVQRRMRRQSGLGARYIPGSRPSSNGEQREHGTSNIEYKWKTETTKGTKGHERIQTAIRVSCVSCVSWLRK